MIKEEEEEAGEIKGCCKKPTVWQHGHNYYDIHVMISVVCWFSEKASICIWHL